MSTIEHHNAVVEIETIEAPARIEHDLSDNGAYHDIRFLFRPDREPMEGYHNAATRVRMFLIAREAVDFARRLRLLADLIDEQRDAVLDIADDDKLPQLAAALCCGATTRFDHHVNCPRYGREPVLGPVPAELRQ